MKQSFEDELMRGMHSELVKQASGGTPDLSKAAECLHAALEIFEEQGMDVRAEQLLSVLNKIAVEMKVKPVQEMPSINKMMEAGLTQRDLHEFSKGNPVAKAKVNLVLRSLGMSDHQIAKFIGHGNVMSEADAKRLVSPNSSMGKIWEWMQHPTAPDDPTNVQPGDTFQMESLLNKKDAQRRRNPEKIHDPATKGLTTKKMVNNLKHNGTPLNVGKADDNAATADQTYEHMLKQVDKSLADDLGAEYTDVMNSDVFDLNASDEELLGMEVKDDDLQVFDSDDSMMDFEDERKSV